MSIAKKFARFVSSKILQQPGLLSLGENGQINLTVYDPADPMKDLRKLDFAKLPEQIQALKAQAQGNPQAKKDLDALMEDIDLTAEFLMERYEKYARIGLKHGLETLKPYMQTIVKTLEHEKDPLSLPLSSYQVMYSFSEALRPVREAELERNKRLNAILEKRR